MTDIEPIAIQAQSPDQLLTDATAALRAEHPTLAERQIITAVARARMRVRDEYVSLGLTSQPGDEHVALVIGLARQELTGTAGTHE